MESAHKNMRLNDWVRMFEFIYYRTQNLERGPFRVFSHLIEVYAGFLKAVYKQDDYSYAQKWVAKVFAWYCALLKSAGITDLEQLIWEKFPRLCPFCKADRCRCSEFAAKPAIDGGYLRDQAARREGSRPGALNAWQTMFDQIYDQSGKRDAEGMDGAARLQFAAMKMMEEFGELSEAIRLQPFYPHHLKNEAADVFGRLCGIVNALPLAFGVPETLSFSELLWSQYPNGCPTCGNEVCTCRPEPVREFISQAGVFEPTELDPLTSVFSAGKLKADILKYSRKEALGSIAGIMIDIDNFKWFNDHTPGKHAQGDLVLKFVAQGIKDSVLPHGSVYRRGGDEFVVILAGEAAAEAEQIACRILNTITSGRVPAWGSGDGYEVGVSLGFALLGAEDDHERLDEVIDQVMYLAKETGKGRVCRQDGSLVDCTIGLNQ